MELKREKSQNLKLSCKRLQSTELLNDEPLKASQLSASTRPSSTPVRITNPSEDEESPYFPCSTQEMNDEVDVLWDWNSPQSKQRPRKSKRRLNLHNSPKVPFKRHPSNNEQVKQDFDKLREELRAFRQDLAKPEHEESLQLSPREEEEIKNESHVNPLIVSDSQISLSAIEGFINEPEVKVSDSDLDDVFNDSMDDVLIQFSQQVENELFKVENGLGKNNLMLTGSKTVASASRIDRTVSSFATNKSTGSKCAIPNDQSTRTKTTFKFYNKPNNQLNEPKPTHTFETLLPQKVVINQIKTIQNQETFNDSLEMALSQMDDDDFEQLTQVVDIKTYKLGNTDDVFPRCRSEDLYVQGGIQMASGKVEFHRTQSFENFNKATLSENQLKEIERKRLEAKAKRDFKRKQEATVSTDISDSPIKCSPEEIEKKRRQAMAKLEAKRQQEIAEIIERNRQGALKRLEESRKKKAVNVKSSLSKRL